MSKKDYLMIGKLKPNTFIGGVGGPITTKELLAAKLSITANEIQSFKIDAQNNVSCYIGVEYQITQGSAFEGDATITSYIDEDDLLIGVAQKTFRSTPNLREIKIDRLTSLSGSMFQYSGITFFKLDNLLVASSASIAATGNCEYVEFKNVTSLGDSIFYDGYSCYRFYAPKCVQLGNSISVNNRCFDDLRIGCIVYLDPILWTVNAGSPDPDLQYLIDRGNDVRAVTNFDLPTIPINITKVNDYGVVVDISWTQPTGSTNAIDYYQIYVNGEYNGRTVSNETTYRIENLEQYSFYTIQVVACDYFYNQSYSEILNIETGAAPSIPIQNIISEYKFENNVFDRIGSNNGTPTNITYEAGLVGKSAVFNGVDSGIIIPNSSDLTFTDGFSDKPFSFSFLLSLHQYKNLTFLFKGDVSNREFTFDYINSEYLFRIYTGGSAYSNNILKLSDSLTPTLDDYYHITGTYSGNGDVNSLKLYVNGIQTLNPAVEIGSYGGMGNTGNDLSIGTIDDFSGFNLDGRLDEFKFWNTDLTPSQALELATKELAGIDINP